MLTIIFAKTTVNIKNYIVNTINKSTLKGPSLKDPSIVDLCIATNVQGILIIILL